MRADPATAADTEGFAARSLLWLQLLTLAVGALQFAFVPSAVEYPLLAAGSLALLTFNVGIEIGQLLFVAAVLAFHAAWQRLPVPRWRWLEWAPVYLIGGASAYWCIERGLAALAAA